MDLVTARNIKKSYTEKDLLKDVSLITGGYSDAMNKKYALADSKAEAKIAQEKREVPKEPKKKTKLSFNEQRELSEIDSIIENLEHQLSDTEMQMAENSSNYIKLNELVAEKDRLTRLLDEKMQRWEYLNLLAEEFSERA